MVLELLLVADDLDGNLFVCLMVEALNGLTKAALAEELQAFVSVAQVVFEYYLVVALIIIIAMVEYVHLLQPLLVLLYILCRLGLPLRRVQIQHMAFDLPLAVLPQIVNLIIKHMHLLPFIVIQNVTKVFDRILRRQWVLRV